MTRALILSSIAVTVSLALAAPAFAQGDASGPDEKYNQVIVYGNDPCPQSTGNEIIVCARLDEGERFRIPQILRDSDAPENTSWTERVRSFETVGAFGTNSCTPSGPGGVLGCTQKLIDAAYEERRTSSDVRFSQLIQEEREKRLATIDEDAAETQARVEQIEKEYRERLEREQGGESNAQAQAAAQNATDLATPPEQ